MRSKRIVISAEDVAETVSRHLFFFVSRVLVTTLATLVYPLARLTQPGPSAPKESRHLLIGAGRKGWELLEYQEISASASEYLGDRSVSRLVFSNRRPMLAEFHTAVSQVNPSHYYFDPRSGSQRFLRALWEAIIIGVLLERNRVIPICVVADFPERRWRLQAAIVSAGHGVVVTYMPLDIVRAFFPHPRVIGPMPFPLSTGTLGLLQNRQPEVDPKWGHLRDKVVFIGMLYEPRKTMIEGIQRALSQLQIPMEILGRMPDGSRIPNEDYWAIVAAARLVVSTSSHVAGSAPELLGHNHLVYKFIEVTAAGTALAIEPVEQSAHLLLPDVDFIAYSSVEEATEKISSVWSRHGAVETIAKNGAAKTASLIENHYYWRSVFGFLDASS